MADLRTVQDGGETLPVSVVEAPARRSLPLLKAAALYFAIVFLVGLLLGPVRVLYLEPVLGPTLAVLCETPFLLAAMWAGAHVAPRAARLDGAWPAYLAVGVIALALQQIADLAVGFGLRGMTFADQFAYFATPPGYVYAVSLVIFALAPLLAHLRRAQSNSGKE